MMTDTDTPAPTAQQIVTIAQAAVQAAMDSMTAAVRDGRVTTLAEALHHLDAYNEGVQSL
jgi:hypothetical protein